MQELIPPLQKETLSGLDKRFLDHIIAGQQHGFFPIADSGFWHGGIHLEPKADLPIVAIADGELVAYRLNNRYHTTKLDDQDVSFSNSFVLLRHEFKTPKGESLRFFSLYMHLLPLGLYSPAQLQAGPPLFLQKRYKVKTNEDGKGLAVLDDAKEKLTVIPKGALFELLPNPAPRSHWSRIGGYQRVQYEDTEGYAKVRGSALAKSSSQWQVTKEPDTPQASQLGLNIREAGNKAAAVRHVAPKGTELRFKEPGALIDEKALSSGKYNELATGGFACFTPETIEVSSFVPETIVYDTVQKPARKVIVRQGEILGYGGQYADRSSLLHFEIFTDDIGFLDNAKGDEWGRRLVKLQPGAVLKKREMVTDPRTRETKIIFQAEAGTTTGRIVVPEQGIPHTAPDGTLWHEVLFDFRNNKTGWIAANDPAVEAVVSPYQWTALWSEPIADEQFAEDGFADAKKLFQALDANGDKTIDTTELRRAYQDADTRQWLKRLICRHPSEWDAGQNGAKWERLREPPWNYKERRAHLYDQARAHIDQMQWWNQAASAVPANPNVYHFHPIGFIEHVNMMAVPLTREEMDAMLVAVATAESMADNPYAETGNRDDEFQGKYKESVTKFRYLAHIGFSYGFIQCQQDAGVLGRLLRLMHRRDPAAFRDTFGTNWQALLTLTNEGVHAIGDARLFGPAAFTSTEVDPNPSDTHRVLITNGEASRLRSSIDLWQHYPSYPSFTYTAFKAVQTEDPRVKIPEFWGDRVRPLALYLPTTANLHPEKVNLWEGKWPDRFMDAGKIDSFRQAQRDLAYADYVKPALLLCQRYRLRSAAGIAVALDRTIQLGTGGAPRLFKRAARALSGDETSFWPNTEAAFLSKLDELSTANGIDRVGKLLSGKDKLPTTTNYDIDTYQTILDLRLE